MAIIKTDGGYNALPISYKRGNPIPLDTTTVWYNLKDLEKYAQEGVTAYVGQIVVFVDIENGSTTAYVISSTSGTLTKLATFEGDINDVLEGPLNNLLGRFNTLVGYKDETTAGITDLSEWHKDHEQSIKEINKTLKEISSKTYFSVQLVDAVDIENNKVTLKDDLEATSAVYGIIYLLKDADVIGVGEDIYKEYMLVQTGTTDSEDEEGNPILIPTYKLTLTGTTGTNLKDYILKSDANILLKLQDAINNLDLDSDPSQEGDQIDTNAMYVIKFASNGNIKVNPFKYMDMDEGIIG